MGICWDLSLLAGHDCDDDGDDTDGVDDGGCGDDDGNDIDGVHDVDDGDSVVGDGTDVDVWRYLWIHVDEKDNPEHPVQESDLKVKEHIFYFLLLDNLVQ